jgi:CheY-like chemotaxis protein
MLPRDPYPDHGKLLVVDDEPFPRDAMAASLRILGFTVTDAERQRLCARCPRATKSTVDATAAG